MLSREMCVIITLLMSLFAFSARADDITIANHSKLTAQFKVVTSESEPDKTITLSPGEKQNPLGRDLEHNETVKIYGVYPSTGASCALSIHEEGVWSFESFYLPHVSRITGYPPCDYDDNLPDCNCFGPHSDYCQADCEDVTNAIVNIYVN